MSGQNVSDRTVSNQTEEPRAQWQALMWAATPGVRHLLSGEIFLASLTAVELSMAMSCCMPRQMLLPMEAGRAVRTRKPRAWSHGAGTSTCWLTLSSSNFFCGNDLSSSGLGGYDNGRCSADWHAAILTRRHQCTHSVDSGGWLMLDMHCGEIEVKKRVGRSRCNRYTCRTRGR